MAEDKITFIGLTNFRNQMKKFGIKPDDRRRHMYIIGKTGMGKSELLQNMAIQDIQNGHGMAFIDPHGDAAERLLQFVPEHRIKDVIYFNPADTDFPFAFNVMENVDEDKKHLVTAGLMGVFKKIWPDVWSARMEYILNNCMLALMDYKEATLLGINWMFSDIEFRAKVIEKIKDPVIKSFWTKEYAKYNQRYEVEATAAIQNKIGQFISNPLIRNIIGQPHSSIDMRKAMDERKIIILNLSKGRVGEDNSRLLGALLITKLYLAAMSRVDIAEKERQDFYLYVDEFQNFATEAFVNILSEARKYRLALTLAHQYVLQMEEHVRDAVFGNMGTLITFRIGAEDGEHMEKEFSPIFLAEDFVNIPKYNVYLKLMVDGVAGQAFSATTLPPMPLPEHMYVNEIIEYSRQSYATPRDIVDKRIEEWANALGVEDVGGGKPSFGMKDDRQMFDAKCTACKKDFKVPFEPAPDRPVYCKDCLKKVLEEKAAKGPGKGGQQLSPKFMGVSSDRDEKPKMPFFAPKDYDLEKEKPEVDSQGLKNLIDKAFDQRKEDDVDDWEDAFFTPQEQPKQKVQPPPVQQNTQYIELKDLAQKPDKDIEKEQADDQQVKKGKLEPGKSVKF